MKKQDNHNCGLETGPDTECRDCNVSSLLGNMSLVYQGIGGKIRALREEKGMTLEELGKQLGLSLTYLSEIERETRIPSLPTLKKISEFFHVPISQLTNSEAKVMTMGKKIKLAREISGMTQKQLATASELSPGMIAQLESGKVYPSLKSLEKLSQALSTSVCYLILERDDIDGLIGAISPEMRELLCDPQVQVIIGSICSMSEEELKLVLNFIHMLNKPGLK